MKTERTFSLIYNLIYLSTKLAQGLIGFAMFWMLLHTDTALCNKYEWSGEKAIQETFPYT